jgi:hypothetical protein
MLVFDWKNKWIFNILLLKTNEQLLTSHAQTNAHS